MKTIGKALMGSALLMILLLGFQRGDARATTWDPTKGFDLTGQWIYDISSPLTLNQSLILQNSAEFIVKEASFSTNSSVTINNKASLTVDGEFFTNSLVTMDNESAIYTAGKFEASNIDLNGIGLFPPRPPRPTPGLPPALSAFNDDFFDALDAKDIKYGAGIFATEQIMIGGLALNFSETPLHGNKFLVAATTQLKGISPEINLTSNLDSSLFTVTYVDPKLTVGDQNYEYAYVTVSAVPVPGTLLLLGAGLLGLEGIGRKKTVC
jgi:hypothetical protein